MGSLPPSAEQGYFAELIGAIRSTSRAQIVIDTAGEPLRQSIDAGVDVIKINADEFEATFDIPATDAGRIGRKFECLQRSGLSTLIVTAGARGALVLDGDDGFVVRAPVDHVISTVGTGDAFLAGFLTGLKRGELLARVVETSGGRGSRGYPGNRSGIHRSCHRSETPAGIRLHAGRGSLRGVPGMNAIFQADEKAIAVDIGASMIKTALISRDGTLGATRRIETPGNPEETAIGVLEGIRQVACDAQLDLNAIAGIGVSVAAFVTADGRIVATAHLGHDWVGYQLGRRLNAELTANYYFALDAPAPTLGEAYYGAGRGCSDFAYVTVSTGVGAGLMLNGAIYTGGLGWAGGVGHIIVDSNGRRICTGCGNRGCLETYAATQGILALASEAIEQRSQVSWHRRDPGEPVTPQLDLRGRHGTGDKRSA